MQIKMSNAVTVTLDEVEGRTPGKHPRAGPNPNKGKHPVRSPQ